MTSTGIFWLAKDMADSDSLSEHILKIIRQLSEQIGPRPSGSMQEAAGQTVLADRLSSLGYATVNQPFSYPKIPAFFPYLTLPAIVLLIVLLLPVQYRFLLVGMPFLIAGLPEIFTGLSNLIPQRQKSQNLIVLDQDQSFADLDFLFCAHVDSARILPTPPSWLAGIFDRYMLLLESLAWIFAFLGLIQITMPELARQAQSLTLGLSILTAVLLIGTDLWQQLSSRQEITRGANDNASGVAVCTALAEYFKANPPQFLKIGYLFPGAEEAGLYGSQAFVRQNRNLNRSVVIINLDMVAKGNKIGLVTQAGRLKPRATSPRINQIIQDIHPGLVLMDYRYRGGDFVPFLKAGYPAVSLEATHNGGLPETYHKGQDTISHLDLAILNEITGLVMLLIRDLDKEKNTEKYPSG
jgi:hypothetical protein